MNNVRNNVEMRIFDKILRKNRENPINIGIHNALKKFM